MAREVTSIRRTCDGHFIIAADDGAAWVCKTQQDLFDRILEVLGLPPTVEVPDEVLSRLDALEAAVDCDHVPVDMTWFSADKDPEPLKIGLCMSGGNVTPIVGNTPMKEVWVAVCCKCGQPYLASIPLEP